MLHLTDILTSGLLRVSLSSWRCQSKIEQRMMAENELTRTLPVSVWADIMTPAQSLTEVIQPTSLAAASSLSVRLIPSPVVIRWTSWRNKKTKTNPSIGYQLLQYSNWALEPCRSMLWPITSVALDSFGCQSGKENTFVNGKPRTLRAHKVATHLSIPCCLFYNNCDNNLHINLCCLSWEERIQWLDLQSQ